MLKIVCLVQVGCLTPDTTVKAGTVRQIISLLNRTRMFEVPNIYNGWCKRWRLGYRFVAGRTAHFEDGTLEALT